MGRGRAAGRDVQEGMGILAMLRRFGKGENWMGQVLEDCEGPVAHS